MRFTGLLRIRNAGDLLPDTLAHMSTFCDEIYVFDDASDDDSADIAIRHPVVRDVLRTSTWNPAQQRHQSVERHLLFQYARHTARNRWFVYLDADERLEFDADLVRLLPDGAAGLTFRLFDYYLTPDDHAPYERGESLVGSRTWIGPEYRDIVMAFDRERTHFPPDADAVREPAVEGRTPLVGYCRHYGKAISVDAWERKCDYYVASVPRLAEKWRARKGGAIHTRSDFGAPLVRWEERHRVAVPVPV